MERTSGKTVVVPSPVPIAWPIAAERPGGATQNGVAAPLMLAKKPAIAWSSR